MGRTRLAKASIAQLKGQVKQAHERKKHLQDYLDKLEKAHSERKISYAHYVETLHKKHDGRNLHELIHHYDHHIKECEKLISKHKKQIHVGRAPAYIIGILIILALMFLSSPSKFKFTGLFIDEGTNATGEANLTSPDNITIIEEIIPSENITAPENITTPENVTLPETNITPSENFTIPETNITTPPENIIPIENATIPKKQIQEKDLSISTSQDLAILNQPVKWITSIKSETTGKAQIPITQDAQNIKLRNTKDGSEKKLSPSLSGPSSQIEVDVISQEDYELEYETPAPSSTEEEMPNGKKVTISSSDSIHYTNVLAFTYLQETLKVTNPSKIKIRWVEQNTFITPDKVSDTNSNGLYDYVEWTVPSLSNQTFEIIVITKAEHLDSNRQFISDIYDQVKSLDNIWSETIPNQDYVRVTFETNLTSSRDITIFPRKTQGNPKVEVYEKDSNTKIAEFININDNQYNKILLTNLQNSQDVFDLKIQGGSLEFDHIIDPSTVGLINGDADSEATGSDGYTENFGKNMIRLDDNNLVAFWSDSTQDPSCSVSTDEGVSWGTIQSVTGNEDGLALATNGSNIIYVGTSVGNGAGDLGYRNNVGGTCTTGAFTDIHADSLDNFKPDVAFDGVHDTYVVCSMDNDDLDLDYAYTSTASISWTSAPGISGAVSSTSCSIDADDNGNVFIASNEGASGIRVYNSSAGTFASTTTRTAYSSQVSNIHLSIRGTEILITAVDSATSDLLVINSSDGITYTNTTYTGTFQDPEGCIDVNGNYHIALVNGSVLAYVRYAGSSFDNYEDFADTGTERYPSVRCTNFPSNNRLGTSELELVFTDTGTNIYFTNITIDTSVPTNNPPNWQANSSNNTSPLPGAGVSHNINWTDDVDLDFAILQVNSSGASCDTIANVTTSVISGTSAWANLSWQIPEACEGKTIGWMQYANDSSNNWNVTSLQYYTVQNVNPTASFGTNPIDNFNSSSSSLIFAINCTDNLLVNQTQLWGNFTGTWQANQTNSTPVNNSVWNVTVSGIGDGNYVWAAWCNDTLNNQDYSDTNRTLKVDTTGPSVTNPQANVSSINQDSLFCLNITATDSLSTINQVFAQLVNTTATANYTMTESGGACSGTAVDGIYGIELNGTAQGLWNYTKAFANDSLNNLGTLDFTDITVNVTAPANTAPQVTQVYNETITNFSSGPNEGPVPTYVLINFTAYDAEGFIDLNMSSAYINFSLSGEAYRSSSCTNAVNFSSTFSNFTCNVSMYWYDGSGSWNINASVNDISNLLGQNSSQNFFLGTTTGMTMSPTSLSWASIIAGTTNQRANSNITINNTGNDEVNIEINATDLRGEINSTFALWAGNFTVNGSARCDDGTTLYTNHTFINITGINLPRGNFSINNLTVGQEEIVVCLEQAGTELIAQSYSTANEGAWTIRIVLVTLSTRLIRRKKKIKKDRIFQAFLLIRKEITENYSESKEKIADSLVSEIRIKYRITRKDMNVLTGEEKHMIPVSIFNSKLGALEALVKYMKENLGMNYVEIADKLQRNERTIWTAYKKAIEKQKSPLTIKDENKLPLELFENKELTILESLITGLKEKGLKYSEIAKLIERNERNVWTTYSRVVKNKQ